MSVRASEPMPVGGPAAAQSTGAQARLPPAPDPMHDQPRQLALELPAPPATAETPLVPVRMVNE